MYHIVEFHADGGQTCILGRRTFTDPIIAKQFADFMRTEPNHTCGQGSVKEYTSETYLENTGEFYCDKHFKVPDYKFLTAKHFVSASCRGEKCSMCPAGATHKVGEEIPADDPNPNRHNLTAYVCCTHFRLLMGQFAPCFK